MVLSVDMGQGPDWTAIAPLIQAKQREIAERLQSDTLQLRKDDVSDKSIAPVSAGGAARADMQPNRDPGGNAQDRTAQIAMQAHIAFKAQDGDGAGLTSAASADKSGSANAKGGNSLTEAEERVVNDLKARDAEVRRHEQAHAAVGGGYASAPSYVYQVGPDGRRYAVGGSVEIDMSPVPGNPEATIAKMEVVRRAAMAPAEPSSADRSVAAAAQAAQAQALADMNAARVEKFGNSLDMRA